MRPVRHRVPASAIRVRDDLARVRQLLASGRPVVALLASEYVAALHPMTPAEIDRRLIAAGFSAVETTVLGEELVAAEYERLLAEDGVGKLRLRSTCPVVVDWVRFFHPGLAEALVPVVSPYLAQARLIRALYPDDTAVVYVSPCWSRKDEALEPQAGGDVDVAIGFDELELLLAETEEPPPPEREVVRPQAAKERSATDGFPRKALTDRNLTNGDVVVARGLAELDRLLIAIGRGETAPAVVDMLNCEGCIDGPCVNRCLSVFVKRGIDAAERRRQPPSLVDSQTLLDALPGVTLGRAFEPAAAPLHTATDAQIDAELAKGEFESRAETIDCGACGYRTCIELAEAIIAGASTWEMCFPLQKRRLEREREQLVEAAVIDTLTGLTNRRGFDRRLAEEVARARRYDTPLSLVMMDLDVFKEINDKYGHATGDALLRAVGVLLNAELRTADVAVRFGGDEFALILPNTPKTDAWAVAEKIRTSIAQLGIYAEDGTCVRTSSSMGIAAVSERILHPADLMDTADKALYRAKRAGRNRVELSAG